MKKPNKLVIAVVGMGVISTVSISSASALEIPNPLAKVFDQWQEQINSINKYVFSTISQKLEVLSESLQEDLKAAVNESVGALGLPDAAGILGAMRTDGLKSKQSQDLANLNLTNISRSLDGQNQARQKESVGQGFNNLRTASQARLF
jgi:hypothetical protein